MVRLIPAIVVVAICSTASAARQPSAVEVAAALQKKYDAIRDFTADFVHQTEGSVLGKKRTERGTLQVKKPGKMRWNYTAPEKKEFISDGQRMYLHVPADKQVMVSPVPATDQATTAVLFLVGKGNLTRDFKVSFLEGGGDVWALRLDPKLPERDYDWLQVTVDRTSMQLRTLTAADASGGRQTFTFGNFKENVGLADKTFVFKIPRGTDVVPVGNAAR